MTQHQSQHTIQGQTSRDLYSWLRAALLHLVILAPFGGFVVVTPVPLNMGGLVAWGFMTRAWARRRPPSWRILGVSNVAVVQMAGMTAVIVAAVAAPVKVVDQQKSRVIILPERMMTLGELADPVSHGQNRFYRFSMIVPEDMSDCCVRFPSCVLTVGQFISTVEDQTPLRHHFLHCGNGSTILWGGDCSFGLSFGPPQTAKTNRSSP